MNVNDDNKKLENNNLTKTHDNRIEILEDSFENKISYESEDKSAIEEKKTGGISVKKRFWY